MKSLLRETRNDPSDTATSWGTPRTEDYTYDANFDYLTGYRFDGGAWTRNTYDAAGNRNDVTAVDNLNRAGAIGGSSRTYDILGNTLTSGAKSMGWDELNRMLSFNPGPGGQASLYTYRADGMRVRKGLMASPNVYTEYAYDGQMPIEEYNYRSVYPISFIKVIRYGLGARGVDYIEKVPANGPLIVGYPIYDDHGNMIATLGKNGVLADQRSYDAWGVIRSGNTTGEPHGQYCANLGHLADDESGLIYMRARYYEPGSGRFVSEDSWEQGRNWQTYCGSDPINQADATGCFSFGDLLFGSSDEALEKALELKNAAMEMQWGSNAIERALLRYATRYKDVLDALLGDDLTLSKATTGRIQITGVDGRYGIGIDFSDFTDPIIKLYRNGVHLGPEGGIPWGTPFSGL